MIESRPGKYTHEFEERRAGRQKTKLSYVRPNARTADKSPAARR